MLFSYNWLKSYFSGRFPSPNLLAKKLTNHSFEVEEIKKKGNDFVLDIDVLPNRAADCFSHIGIAKEISAIFGLKMKNIEAEISLPKKINPRQNKINVSINGKNLCSRYTLIKVAGAKIGESPKWIKERLKAIGLKPINNIVDITNFVMLETGQPAHAFDAEKIIGQEIIVRSAKKGEKMMAIGGTNYTFKKGNEIVIADKKEAIAIAGIKGGENTAINKKTNQIIIELANFNKVLVRSASKELKLRTDASWRFENGISPNLIDLAIKRISFLLKKYAEAKKVELLFDYYPKKQKTKKITVGLDYLSSISGNEIKAKEAVLILKKLGFRAAISKEKLIVSTPESRLDINGREDIAEEVWRMKGYSEIKEKPPISELHLVPKNSNFELVNRIKEFFSQKGFIELYNYSFISDSDADLMVREKRRLIQLENPMSSLYSYLRPTLMINLIKKGEENLKAEEEIKLFEVGSIFEKKKGKIIESTRVGGIVKCKNKEKEIATVKQAVNLLLSSLKTNQPFFRKFKNCPFKIWAIGKSAEIILNNKIIGIIGETCAGFSAFELDVKRIKEGAGKNKAALAKEVSIFQRDISIETKKDIEPIEIISRMKKIAGGKIKEISLFDIYQKGNSLKKMSFRISYQINKPNAKRKDIESIHKKILKEFNVI